MSRNDFGLEERKRKRMRRKSKSNTWEEQKNHEKLR